MGLYQRIAGGDESVAKIPIWPLINSFGQLLSGEIDQATFAARYNLDATEQVEFGQASAKIQTDIAAVKADYEAAGFSAARAEQFAKTWANAHYKEVLMSAECRDHNGATHRDEASWKAEMGIS